jgi:hypothetical protein
MTNMNRKDGFSLSRAWKPLIRDLKERRQSLTEESPHPVSPEKGLLRLSYPPPPPSLTPVWSFPTDLA